MLDRTPLRRLLVVAGLVVSSGIAQAEPFAMHSELRNFCCTDWLGRTFTPTPLPNPGGGAFGFIGDVVVQPATVARTVQQTLATPPFDLSVPANRIGTHFSVSAFPHPNPLIDLLTLSVSIDNRSAVLRAGEGPGSLEFCPIGQSSQPLYCAAYWPSTPGPGSFNYHGRIAISAGPNQFGGAMGWLGSGLTGVLNRRNGVGLSATRFTAEHFVLPFSVVGASTALSQSQPTAAGAMAIAPVAEHSFVYSTSMHYANSTANPSAVPVSTLSGTGRATGHVWTTGMVTVSATNGAVPPWMAVTLTGSDNRATTGPDIGSGNLTLVSANLYQDYPGAWTQVRGTSIRMTLPEPDAAIGVGLATLALLWLGIAGRRDASSGRI